MGGSGLWLASLLTTLFLVNATPKLSSSQTSPKSSTRQSHESADRLSDNVQEKPNIIIIIADDMGWNDVSFHGSNQIPTPNIDAIAYNGVILNSHYVSALCTPSRSSLMTGKYPIHTGMQHLVIMESEPRGLPLSEKILPQHMKDVGYKTHAIGKWHLGFHRKEYTPTYRGFDSHFGYWQGLQDYYTHEVASSHAEEGFIGFDMRRNMSIARDTIGKYSTDLFTEEAVNLIESHDKSNPMFLYFAHLAPHSGNDIEPLQAPDEEIAKFSYIQDPERRIYAAMMSKLDESVGEVVAALRRRQMLENSIIIFMADNGGATQGIHYNRGSNYPLRGIKGSAWDGAVRGTAAIWSPLIKKTKRVSNHLIHLTDWLPTLYAAAGGNPQSLGQLNGFNMWPTLTSEAISPRSEVLINIDPVWNYSALRRGDFKYVLGSIQNGDEWYGDTGLPENSDVEGESPPYDPQTVMLSRAGTAISGEITAQHVSRLRKSRHLSYERSKDTSSRLLTAEEVLKLRSEAVIECNVKPQDKVHCNPLESPCLFNIRDDPCEMVNLAKSRPMILATLEEALMKHRVTMVPPNNVPNDPKANPALWGGNWVPWQDEVTVTLAAPPKISGVTFAIIAVLLGLSIVGIFVFIGIQWNKRTRSKSYNKHGNFEKVQTNEEATLNEEDVPKSTEIAEVLGSVQDLQALKSASRSID